MMREEEEALQRALDEQAELDRLGWEYLQGLPRDYWEDWGIDPDETAADIDAGLREQEELRKQEEER